MLQTGLNQKEAKRKLASIQVIKEVNPIPDADSIEVASVLSWKVVVRKGEFKPGDKIVYFEIDSFLPPSEKYSFVGKKRINPITLNTANEMEGYRLATAVLRKQVSQGLILRFDELDPEFSSISTENLIATLDSMDIGSDVSELLSVTKFDRPEIANELGNLVGTFPSHLVSKTDEERIQTEPASYKEIKGQPYILSSKIDGTSITVIWKDGELICATRNNTLDKFNAIEKMLEAKGVLKNLQELGEDIVFQSELYGTGIQGNKLGIQDKRLATFTIIKEDEILGLEEMLDYVDKLGLEIPEIIEIGSTDENQILRILNKINAINAKRGKVDPTKNKDGLLQIQYKEVLSENFNYSVDEIIERVNGMKYETSGRLAEGVVVRPIATIKGREPVSFKVINNKFLLKEEK